MTRPVITVRAAASPADLAAIQEIDYSYSTDRIYQVCRGELGFQLREERVSPPLRKFYSRPPPELSDRLLLACAGAEVIGYAELQVDAWSRRAQIEQLIVTGRYRGQGAGRALIRALDERARREPGARCLWLETQNINYPAVQFYLRTGFRLCGLDDTLYRPGLPGLLPGEVALYFTRYLA